MVTFRTPQVLAEKKKEPEPIIDFFIAVEPNGSVQVKAKQGDSTYYLLEISKNGGLYRFGGCQMLKGIKTDGQGRIEIEEF